MKKLLTIAASTVFLGAVVYAEPANAGRDRCWFQMKPNAPALDPVSCRISERTNSNGHRVYDVIEGDGYTRTVVLWGNARAEVLVEGKNLKGDWQVDADGDVRISMDAGGDWAFKPKNISAISAGQSVKVHATNCHFRCSVLFLVRFCLIHSLGLSRFQIFALYQG